MRLVLSALKWLLYYFLAITALSIVSVFLGTEWTGELFLFLPFGWIPFIHASYSRLTVNGAAAITFVVATLAFCFLLHRLLHWAAAYRRTDQEPKRNWRWSWSGAKGP